MRNQNMIPEYAKFLKLLQKFNTQGVYVSGEKRRWRKKVLARLTRQK